MRNNTLMKYTAISLAILIPIPGRFAYGLIIILAMNFFLLCGTLFRRLILKLDLSIYSSVLIGAFLVMCAVIFKQLLILYSPIIAFILGFSIYIIAISSYLIGIMNEKISCSLATEIEVNMSHNGVFSLFALLFFLIRDFFGYGTITFPVRDGLYAIHFNITENLFSTGVLLSSIPGTIFFSAILIIIIFHISKKIEIAGTSYESELKKENKNDAE